MKYRTIVIFLTLLVGVSCKETTTGPTSGINLLSNSTFELNGVPTLQGWTVPDTSAVHFSSEIPLGGTGHSVVFQAQQYGPWWWWNSIYTMIPAPSGAHRYRLSIFGKKTGIGGSVSAFRNRPPGETDPASFISLGIVDTVWTFYSHTDTLTTVASDTIFITVFGGGTESRGGTTYFNTCKFEKLD